MCATKLVTLYSCPFTNSIAVKVSNFQVQNCFVDTHDVRFPWVAFFSKWKISAGEELNWDYNYIVDQVPGKEIYCECGAENCRGRLL